MTKKARLGGLSQFRKEVKELTILPELESYIPGLTNEESALLKESLKEEGLRDAIEIWIHDDVHIIIDGHNRYKLCKELGIPIRTKEKIFDDIEQVKKYMLKIQLGRRNLTDEYRTLLIGRLYNEARETKGGYKKDLNLGNITNKRTSEVIAEQVGTTEKTVRSAGQYTKGLEKLSPSLQKEIITGTIKIPKKHIQKLASIVVKEPIETESNLYKLLENPKNGQEKKQPAPLHVTYESEEIKHYKDEIYQVLQPQEVGDELAIEILESIIMEIRGKEPLRTLGSDFIKLINSGYRLIRTDDTPSIRIKFRDKDNHDWKTLGEPFKSKAARDRQFKELLKHKKTISA